MTLVYGIEGLDRLGKSSLIQGIQHKLGYHQVIHFAKPQRLKVYEEAAERYTREYSSESKIPEQSRASFLYQHDSFLNSMFLAKSGARVIFDRWHIGEAVYSPMYRGYSGDYVFEQELLTGIDTSTDIRLILLVEDFSISKHFVDDGNSLGPTRNRELEQQLFTQAVFYSNIKDKRTICVTDSDGEFRSKDEILEEALS